MWISKGGPSQVLLAEQEPPDLAGIRTYDPVNVERAIYHCATRPVLARGKN